MAWAAEPTSGLPRSRARIEETPSTKPEELIGAAHAGCFTMSLASLLGEEGHPPDDLSTTAKVRLEQREDGGFSITSIALATTGRVDGVDEARFAELAERAKATCRSPGRWPGRRSR